MSFLFAMNKLLDPAELYLIQHPTEVYAINACSNSYSLHVCVVKSSLFLPICMKITIPSENVLSVPNIIFEILVLVKLFTQHPTRYLISVSYICR